MVVAIISLSISLFIVSIAGFILFDKNMKQDKLLYESNEKIVALNNNISVLKTKMVEYQLTERKNYELLPGNKCLIYEYGLQKGKESFKVNYEVEILEVTPTKLKVKAYDFTSTDSIGTDPSNKQAIIDFLNGKWVNKSSAQIILDDSHIRELKLSQIL